MRRTSVLLFIILIISVSAGICSEPINLPMPAVPQPPPVPRKSVAVLFEEFLNNLARNNMLPDSFVAVIDPIPLRRNPNQPANEEESVYNNNVEFDPSTCKTLDDLAQAFGLQIFQDKGLYVLALPTTLDLSAMISGQWMSHYYNSKEDIFHPLIASFTRDQLTSLGSPAGLSIQRLNTEQRSMLDVLIDPASSGICSNKINTDVGPPITLANASISKMIIGCRLIMSAINLKAGDSEYEADISNYYNENDKQRRLFIGEWSLIDNIYPQVQPPMVPNYLKPGDLDYNKNELDIVLNINETISLRDLVNRIARDSGLKLLPCQGAEKIKLYIHSRKCSAGSILKAVALATQSTWRDFGNGYILTADSIGVSQAFINVKENEVKREIFLSNAKEGILNPDWVYSVFQLLPFDKSDFNLTPQQIQMIAKWNGEGPGAIPVNMLTSEQQLFLQRKLQQLDQKRNTSGQPELQHPVITHITPIFSILMAIKVPEFGIVDIRYPFQLIRKMEVNERLNTQAPQDVSISIDKPVRGLMLKPQKEDTPESIIRTMTEHGFNTLYLRVFSDGYTIFPCSAFPCRVWASDAEYLKKIIKDAHAKGIKVFAVVDVLRWSDGDKGHWVRKQPELLDYDILSRTQSEWASLGISSKKHARVEQFLMVDARKGDVVTPLSPFVRSKLLALISE